MPCVMVNPLNCAAPAARRILAPAAAVGVDFGPRRETHHRRDGARRVSRPAAGHEGATAVGELGRDFPALGDGIPPAAERAERLAQGAAARGIYVRNRSTEPGLEGCLRVGAGVVAHTERCIDVFEEVLCGAE